MAGHDEMGGHQSAARRGEATEEGLGHGERWVGQHSKRPAGESQIGGIGLHDDDAGSTETLPEVTGTLRMALDGDDPRSAVEQGTGQRAAPGADVEDELTGTDRRVADEPEGPVPIELVPSPLWRGFPGHGGPSSACPREKASPHMK